MNEAVHRCRIPAWLVLMKISHRDLAMDCVFLFSCCYLCTNMEFSGGRRTGLTYLVT